MWPGWRQVVYHSCATRDDKGEAEKISFMIDGLHHKLATIGAPSRLSSAEKKKSRAPIHFPYRRAALCTFASQPCYRSSILGTKKIYKQSFRLLHRREGRETMKVIRLLLVPRENRRFLAPISPMAIGTSGLTNGPTDTPACAGDDEGIISPMVITQLPTR